MAKWYQNAVINGREMPAQRQGDTSQKRWKELLQPLIPEDGNGRLFLDLGCNAGFYLRKASELGYSTWGVEKEVVYYDQSQYWESQDPRGVRIEMGDINTFNIPANFLTLIANVHYWLTPDQNKALIEKLLMKSLNVLVVSRFSPDVHHLSDCTRSGVGELFENFILLNESGNEKHFSILYRNPSLEEYDTKNLYDIQPFIRSRYFLKAWLEFIDLVVSRRSFKLEETLYWQYAEWRRWRNKERHLKRLKEMILLTERNGITDPIEIRSNGLLKDGNHRLILAEYFGIKRLICRPYST